MLSFFNKNDKDNKAILYLNEEINKLNHYFKESKSLNSKHQIRDKALFVKLKQRAILSQYDFIYQTQKILFSEELEDVYLAIEYLEAIDNSNFTNSENLELLLYKAYIYELLDNNIKARKSYKSAIRLDKTSNALKEYKEFQDRINELKEYKESSSNNTYVLEEVIELYKDPNSAQKIENVAKYYIRSKKSLALAQKYFKMCLDTYRDLAQYNPKKYQMQYILSLIKSVEVYKMPKEALKEAELLIFHNCRDKEVETYLLNKINALKNSN